MMNAGIGRKFDDRVKKKTGGKKEELATEQVLTTVIEELEKPHKTALEHTESAKSQVKKMVEDTALGEGFLRYVGAIKARRNRPYKEVREEQKRKEEESLRRRGLGAGERSADDKERDLRKNQNLLQFQIVHSRNSEE